MVASVEASRRESADRFDNLTAHHVAGVRETIETQARPFLPQYSPDLDPVGRAFAKLKALLRKAAARSVRSLWRRLGIEPPEDVIAGMVGDPDAKRSAFTIGMAGISPAMTIPREWDVL
jgi:hypothetical protein